MNEDLYEENYDKLVWYARGIAARLPKKTTAEAEDMVQEALLKAWEARERYKDDGGASFATFSYQQMRWGALNTLNHHDWKKYGVMDRGRELVDLTDAVEDETPLQEDETYRDIIVGMDRLTERQKQCTTLYLAGYTYREISELVGLRESTVNEYVKTGALKLLGCYFPKRKDPGRKAAREAAYVPRRRGRINRVAKSLPCLGCGEAVMRNAQGIILAYCDACEPTRPSIEGLGGHAKAGSKSG